MAAKRTRFQNDLQGAVTEKDIENIWRSEIRKEAPRSKITSPHNTDGILVFNNIHTLLEFKDKRGFRNKRIRCAVLMQALFYLHNIMEAKEKVPSTVFVGDNSECFFVRTGVLADYLNMRGDAGNKLDWSVAPSQASSYHIPLLNAMYNDARLDKTLVIDVQSDTFRVKDIIPILEDITENVGRKIKIDEHNLMSAFQYFKDNVVKSNMFAVTIKDDRKRVSRLIDVFYNCITDKETTAPNREGNIVSRGEVIRVDPEQNVAFFNLFEQNIYTVTERERLVAIKDQVLDEIMRRMTGAYFTPELWINKAHEMIAEQFGEDWKEKYVVWDCASGTNNLTRVGGFKDLYSSTLEHGDVDTVKDMGYSGTTFQYDFLNEDTATLKKKCPQLFRALTEKKPILFVINPPYGTAGGKIAGKGENKGGIAKTTLMNVVMKHDNIGSCSEQLYAQFIYRILLIKKKFGLTNIKICFFSTPLFMAGGSFSQFRTVFYEHFNFKDGMLFKADQFSDVSGEWGISFTMWEGKP